ncbi:hypothetical protein ACMXYN_04650 [Neptuniibacter sp. PT8_73]|uniref:hypothetical protein n=1 Tax=unclassified Neptuniibacter TaxID=2630693 RepID=UPI0039F6B7FA
MSKKLTNELFEQALFNEDELGSVIKAHLHIEYLINEVLILLAPSPQHINSLKLDYAGKITLLCILGMNPEFKPMLSTLGTMRNNFAHDPFYKLDKSTVKNLYNSLPPVDKENFHNAVRETRNSEEHRHVKPYKELSPRDQFILIVVVIRTIILKLKDQARLKHNGLKGS